MSSVKTHFHDVPKRRSFYASDIAEQTVTRGRSILKNTDALPKASREHRRKGYIIITFAMLTGIGLLLLINFVISPAVQFVANHWQYGQAKVSYQELTLNGQKRDVVGIVYKGSVEIVILPDLANKNSHTQTYALPDYLNDKQTRLVTLTTGDINHDGQTDILLSIENMVINPVLYGTKTGFQWTQPG